MARAKGRVREVGEQLAEAFIRAVPLRDASEKDRKRQSEEERALETASSLEKFYELARNAREQHRLGVIGRARVAFHLQQRLITAGYPPQIVKQVLFAMLVSAFVGNRR